MAAFSGTKSKCKSCTKTVYPMEEIVVENASFHKSCFRCDHCKGTLKLNAFVSIEGVFYCKPHYDQLFTATGSLAKSFDEAIKLEKEKAPPPESITGESAAERYSGKKNAAIPLAGRFGGTQEKCVACSRTVYPLEKVAVEKSSYHASCFKCTHGCTLTTANFKTYQGNLYCKAHFDQLVLKSPSAALQSPGVSEAAGAASPDASAKENAAKVDMTKDPLSPLSASDVDIAPVLLEVAFNKIRDSE